MACQSCLSFFSLLQQFVFTQMVHFRRVHKGSVGLVVCFISLAHIVDCCRSLQTEGRTSPPPRDGKCNPFLASREWIVGRGTLAYQSILLPLKMEETSRYVPLCISKLISGFHNLQIHYYTKSDPLLFMFFQNRCQNLETAQFSPQSTAEGLQLS